jgi:hypothetical protein
MDVIAATQAELLVTQMRSPGADSHESSADEQLTPRQRFHKLMQGEAP